MGRGRGTVREAPRMEQAFSKGQVAGSIPVAHLQEPNGTEAGAVCAAPVPLINTRDRTLVMTRKLSISGLIPTNQPGMGLIPEFSEGLAHERPTA